ncbi:MAG: hypothetical protein ABSG37_05010 [Candidatus Limnocylindrales bacterium]|jgi:hypothetical protein
MVELLAYAADCRVHGQIELAEARLSDQLNGTLELLVLDARIEDLADGHVVATPELTVSRDELCAVVASGPRGDAARRLHTITTRVEVEVGPYWIVGWVHSMPTSGPLGAFLRQVAWVPLTEATVKYRYGAADVRDKVTTLLVNRHLMCSFRAVEEAGLELPWEAPREPKAAAPGAGGSTSTQPEGARPGGDQADPPTPSKPTA